MEKWLRKEIKNFMENSTIKQFEDKLIDRIGKEIKRGKLEGDVKDIIWRRKIRPIILNKSGTKRAGQIGREI